MFAEYAWSAEHCGGTGNGNPRRTHQGLSHDRYGAGATSYLEVLTNETNYYNAELSLSQARFSEVLALVQVYNALGGGVAMSVSPLKLSASKNQVIGFLK